MNVARTLKRAIRQHQRGYPADARATCNQVLRYVPRNPEAHHLMGLFCKDAGDLDDAERHLLQALKLDETVGDYHNSLGMVLALQGRLAEAADCLERAVSLAPAHLGARQNLGRVLQRQGRLAEAADCWRIVAHQAPRQVEPSFNLGNLCYTLGAYDEAICCFEQVLALRPGHIDGLNNLATALMAAGRMEEAEAVLRRAIGLAPDVASLHANLGAVLSARSHVEAPIACYERALALDPTYHKVALKLANHLLGMGRLEEAGAHYRATLARDPSSLEALAGLANVLERGGEREAALEVIRPWLHLAPRSANLAAAYATLCRRTDRSAEAIPLLKSMLQSPMPGPERSMLCQNLGHLLDAVGEHPRAFEAWREGNALRGLSFDAGAWARQIDAIAEVFSAEALAALPRAADSSELPVLIVGMPRSGTSLVEQILTSHPGVHGGGELELLRVLTEQLPGFTGQRWPGAVGALDAGVLETLSGRYLGHLRGLGPGAARVTDKMPHNFLRLGFAAQLTPGARVIHCRRDPVDTAMSCFRQDFSAAYGWSTSLEGIAAYYRGYERLMEHWRAAPPLPMFEVDYEHLVAEPEAVIPELVAFCGLDWDEACLHPDENRRVVKTASYDQVRKPIYTDSVRCSAPFAAQLTPFEEALEGLRATGV